MPRRSARLGAGAFDPALDQPLAADPLAEQCDRLHAVVHPPAAQRIGNRQPRQHALVHQQRMHLVDGRRLVVEEVNGRAAVGGLARRDRKCMKRSRSRTSLRRAICASTILRWSRAYWP